MKKILFFVLVFAILGAGLFADDAKVMPLRTGRLSLAPSFTFGQKAFNKDGVRRDSDALSVYNFGAALEYGINSWITGALQWAPGVNFFSDIDMLVPSPDGGFSKSLAKVQDVADLFLGAKIQILGTAAPVKTDNFRIAFAPGLKIPLRGPDYEKQYENAKKGDPVTVSNFDNHAFAAGLRSYFDFVITDNFFINLYNETIFYAQKREFKKAGYTEYAVSRGIDTINSGLSQMELMFPGASAAQIKYGDNVKFGYDVTFELEPTWSFPIADGVLFSAFLPFRYKITPGKKYDKFTYNETAINGTVADINTALANSLVPPGYEQAAGALAQGLPALLDNVKKMEDSEGMTHYMSLEPSVALFFYQWKVPFEFEFGYKAPIWGKGNNNGKANHTLVIIAKMFFKI
ncbi:MAG: hypothetical protein FWH41_10335 [Treponema sp.]|nr:hypothetical protein [Treponema sp.]